MAKTSVALLLSLLVLVGPAAAQDPGPQSGDPQGEPQPPPSDPPATEPAPNQSQSGNKTTAASPEAPARTSCRVVGTHLFDPQVSPSRWVIVDPDGCFRQLIRYVLSRPA